MAKLREVAPGVMVGTSRQMSTNSTLLAGGSDALLIDPAWLPDELDALASEIQQRDLRVIGGFATHAHQDHLLWHQGFGAAPRWASEATANLAALERKTLIDLLGPDFPADLADLMGRVRAVDGSIPQESVPDGFEIELLIHDGHAPGHTALWLPEHRVLIAGDMLSDVELPLPFYPDDLPAYMDALDRLAPFAARATMIVPGHGHVGSDPIARLDADRRYIEEMAARGSSDDPRVHNPGMQEAHSHMKELVGAGRTGAD